MVSRWTGYVCDLESANTGLNTRFRITLPTLRIPEKGETAGSGTISFIPIEDEN